MMTCRVCQIPLRAWGATNGVALLKCPECGSIHADCPKPADDMYADIYARDEEVPPVVASSLDSVVDSMASFRGAGRWLDVGFGQGALLDAVARGGWSCFGTELSSVALEKGRARGFTVDDGTERFDDGAFDVVSLVEFVEHVEDPSRFLKEARRVLRAGGCLYVTTPNVWSLNRWFLGPSWSVFAPPDHVTLFTPPGLRRLLSGCGFTRVSLRVQGLNPFEVLRKMGREEKPGFHRTDAGTRLCASLSSSPARRGLKRTANALLNATRLGDSLKVTAC